MNARDSDRYFSLPFQLLTSELARQGARLRLGTGMTRRCSAWVSGLERSFEDLTMQRRGFNLDPRSSALIVRGPIPSAGMTEKQQEGKIGFVQSNRVSQFEAMEISFCNRLADRAVSVP